MEFPSKKVFVPFCEFRMLLVLKKVFGALGTEFGISHAVLKENKNLVFEVLKSAVKEINKRTEHLPVLLLEDIDTYLDPSDFDRETNRYLLPSNVKLLLNECMQMVSKRQLHVFLTISEVEKLSSFRSVSGNDRISELCYQKPTDSQVMEMLASNVPFLEEKFGEQKEMIAYLLAEKIGGDMGAIMQALKKLRSFEIPSDLDPKQKQFLMQSLVSRSLQIPLQFSYLMEKGLILTVEF